MYLVNFSNCQQLKRLMHQAGVDPYGARIMFTKASTVVLHLRELDCVKANILKQEMLSLSGDAAVSKLSITGKIKTTDCFLIGSISQFAKLVEKLSKQPLGLSQIGKEIKNLLENAQIDNYSFCFGNKKLEIVSDKSYIVGIINVTPDSFSGDGLYRNSFVKDNGVILEYAQKLIKDGADILDIGGESSRPGALPVSLKEELGRVIPVVKLLAKKIKIPISVDTCKPEVAKEALENGAVIINDITGLKDAKMRKCISRYKAGAIVMHSKGSSLTMQDNPSYGNLIEEMVDYFTKSLEYCWRDGIDSNRILIDPGIGFGKTLKHNLEILKNLKAFKVLGRPILIGTSRKSFIGKILKAQVSNRLAGTIATSVIARQAGVNFFRVHDVKEIKEALKIQDEINVL